MNQRKFSFGRLLLYFGLVTLFLFVSGNTGQYLIHSHGMDRELGMLLQGVIFTSLTLLFLYMLRRRNPEVLENTGLKHAHASSRLIVGLVLPFALLLTGILSAYAFGGIDHVRLNLSAGVLMAILINTVTAFLYEAFPEEVFIRGLIADELQKKFSFTFTLVLQPLIFVCVPIAVTALSFIFFDSPFSITIDYLILLILFGVALQLYRKYTGTLWMSIFFHLVYLEVTRYISMGGAYDSKAALITFEETFGGFMLLYLSFLFIVVLSIVVLSILLIMDKRKRA